MPCKADEDLLCPSIQLYLKIVDNAIKVIGSCWGCTQTKMVHKAHTGKFLYNTRTS